MCTQTTNTTRKSFVFPSIQNWGALEGAVLKINVFAQIGSTNLAKITNITTYVKLKIET